MGRVASEDIFRARRRAAGQDWRKAHLLKRADTAAKTVAGGSRRRPTAAPTPGGAGAKTKSREAVLKPIAWIKSRGGIVGSLRYVARNRTQDSPTAEAAAGREEGREADGLAEVLGKKHDLPMWTETGQEVRGEQIHATMKSWGLTADADNLSAKARAADPEARAEMSINERLYKRQALHLIYSVPAQDRALTRQPERFKAALDAGLTETLGRAGAQYLYTIHIDQGRMHAHIIVKAQLRSSAVAAPTQLRWDRQTGQAIKAVLTDHMQAAGIDARATRRVDRAEQEPARDKSWFRAKVREREFSRQVQEAAPEWTATHGAAWEQRQIEQLRAKMEKTTGAKAPPEPQEPARATERPSLLSRLLRRRETTAADQTAAPNKDALPSTKTPGFAEHFNGQFKQPTAAAGAFLDLYREAPRLAGWALKQRPEMFGQVDGKPAQPRFNLTAAIAEIAQDAKSPLRDRATAALRDTPDPRIGAADLKQELAAGRRFEASTKTVATSLEAGRMTAEQLRAWGQAFGPRAAAIAATFETHPDKAAGDARALAAALGHENGRLNAYAKAAKELAGTPDRPPAPAAKSPEAPARVPASEAPKHQAGREPAPTTKPTPDPDRAGRETRPAAAFIADRSQQRDALRAFERDLSAMARRHDRGELGAAAVGSWANGQAMQGRAAVVATAWHKDGPNVFAEEARKVGAEIKKIYAQIHDAERRTQGANLGGLRSRREDLQARTAPDGAPHVAKERNKLLGTLKESPDPALRAAAEKIDPAAVRQHRAEAVKRAMPGRDEGRTLGKGRERGR